MLGKKLKDLRIEKGYTLSAVAKEIGVSTASLSKYEHGIHIPGDLPMARLANFYGITREELLKENLEEGSSEPYNNKNKVCPWRIRQGIDQRTGNTVTWFMPCLGAQCMAYEEGFCGMLENNKRALRFNTDTN